MKRSNGLKGKEEGNGKAEEDRSLSSTENELINVTSKH